MPGEPPVTVDDLEVAQFVYLLLRNEKIRRGHHTVASKAVLILGRFTPERKEVLDALRGELRRRSYAPIVFDFEKPASKDLTGTIQMLANLAQFIVADLTDPSSVPYELATVVPRTKVPLQALIRAGEPVFALFRDLMDYPWVLKPYRYESIPQLLAALPRP